MSDTDLPNNNTAPSNLNEAVRECFHIIGIGASAGGLEPLERFFAQMPKNSGMAFVVVQHLSPDFKSQMEQLLSRHTQMPIYRVVDGIDVKPNSIYLIPPRKMMVISNNCLLLTDKEHNNQPSLPIDEFFRSLANEAGRFAVGIVLSGTGADGSKGVVDIARAGGLVLTQDEDSAHFDSMPLNAVATGVVTLSIPPEIMPDTLVRYVREALTPDTLASQDLLPEESDLRKVIGLLKKHSGIDFTQYKTSTVSRRIKRRLLLTNEDRLKTYLSRIESDTEELENLYQDLLIGVTRFFRDIEMFTLLENKVIPELIRSREDEGQIRVWVTACATGQEAYSVAMLFLEQLEALNSECSIKIFATDVHQQSIKFASAGVYTESAMSSVPLERKKRFFHFEDNHYTVSRELRRVVSFANHNLISDAPFTKIDFISCRNLLIYLQTSVQKKVLSLFHFSLRTRGVLSLGSSETLGELSDEYEEINARQRLYYKKRDVRLPADSRFSPKFPEHTERGVYRNSTQGDGALSFEKSLISIYDRLLDQFLPSGFLLDDKFQLVHVFAGGERFLRLRSGRPTKSFLDMVPQDVRTTFSGALSHAVQTDKSVNYSGVNIQDENGVVESCIVSVQPISESRTRQNYFLICIKKNELADIPAASVSVDMSSLAQEHIKSLESELRFTQENLQATIEELETANEEMQASNEELVASNEELQSTNEELQSLNEELHTVNTEYQVKITEVIRANDDMDNLLATTRVGVIFLDKSLCIRRFTPEIARLFHLLPQDIGRAIAGFSHTLQFPEMLQELKHVLDSGMEYEGETRDQAGNPYILRILPYRGAVDIEPQGVLLTLVDVSSLKSAQAEIERFKLISDATSDGHAFVSIEGRFEYINSAFIDYLGVDAAELTTKKISDFSIDLPVEKISDFFDNNEAVAFKPFVSSLLRMDGKRFDVELNLTPFIFNDNKKLLFINLRDISERIRIIEDLELRTNALESATNGILIANNSAAGETIYANESFHRITGYKQEDIIGRNCRFLQGRDTSQSEIEKIRNALEKQHPVNVTLLNYKKSGEPFWNDLYISPVVRKNKEVSHFVGIINDVTGTIEAQDKIREDAKQIEILFNSTEEGIFLASREGNFTFCNKSAVTLLGYDGASEILGRNIEVVFSGNSADGGTDSSRLLHRLLHNEVYNTDKEFFTKKDGLCIPVEYWCHPIPDENDGAAGYVITFIDITQRNLDQKNLLAMQRKAERANKAKSVFLANISHELRTPLTAILGFTELLSAEVDDVEARRKLSILKKNGHHLLNLLNDLLDLSQIESGFVKIEKSPASIPDLIEDLRTLSLSKAEVKGLALDFEVLNSVPKFIEIDAIRVRQILINLLNNAFKFTEKGRILFSVEYDKDNNFISFTVADTGCGIDSKDLAVIFEPFNRGDDIIKHIEPGSGLGLSISLQLANQMQGDLKCESKVDQGSRFTLQLPCGDASNDNISPGLLDYPQALPNSLSAASLDVTIVMADDCENIREFIDEGLSRLGAKVVTFENGRELLSHLSRQQTKRALPDIILLDVHMPVLDGLSAVKEIRAMNINCPTLAITASAMKGEREKFLSSGFDDYVSKPVSIKALAETITKLLKKNKKDSFVSAAKNPNQPTKANNTKHHLKVLIVEDNADIAALFQAVLSTANYHLDVASTGEEALIKAKDFQPDICLMDLSLPDANGIDVGREILKSINSTLKIIATTGHDGEALIEETKRAGFSGFLVKPISVDALLGMVKKNEPQ